MRSLPLVLLSLFIWNSAIPASAQEQPEWVVVTKQDLLKMADLPQSLVLSVIENADELPLLQPADVTELAAAGVDPMVLEAIVSSRRQRPLSTPSQPTLEPEPAPAPAPPSPAPLEPAPAPSQPPPAAGPQKRIQVTADLSEKAQLFSDLFRRSKSFAVYWAATLNANGRSEKIPVEDCPREPVCWCVTPTGERRCIGPQDQLWRQHFSCLRAVEMGKGEVASIFDFTFRANPESIDILPFLMARDRDDSLYLQLWESTALDDPTNRDRRRRVYIHIEPGASQSYEAELDVSLEMIGSSKTDLRLPVMRFDNRDPDAPRPESPIRLAGERPSGMLPAELLACPAELGR